MHSRHFTQPEFETAQARHLKYGRETAIATTVGKTPGMISQYLSPHDNRESPGYKHACILAAWIEDDIEGGTAALEEFNSFVRRALPGDDSLCVNKMRVRSHKERTDFVIAESEHADIDDRIRELEESMAADANLLSALKAERRRSLDDRPVDTSVRDLVRSKHPELNGRKRR